MNGREREWDKQFKNKDRMWKKISPAHTKSQAVVNVSSQRGIFSNSRKEVISPGLQNDSRLLIGAFFLNVVIEPEKGR